MEVIYKKRIMDRIGEEDRKAAQQSRVIEKIILTDKEWQQLKQELDQVDRLYLHESSLNPQPKKARIHGIKVVHEKEAEND